MQPVSAVVCQNVAPMRAAPDTSSEQVSQALFGETVTILAERGAFRRIRTPDAYEGWARAAHLAALEAGRAYPEPTHAAVVSDLILPVQREASAQSERLTLLTLGTVVEVGGGEPQGCYYPIRLPAGGVGYVDAGALIVPRYPPRDRIGPNLAVVARGFLGVPYLWGGRSTFGIDCSGFTQRVYALCGVGIPRDADMQAAWAGFEPADRTALQAGDLIFFASGDDPHDRPITHVGMALGDDRFIHAAGAAGVTVTPLDEPPYDAIYHSACRLAPS